MKTTISPPVKKLWIMRKLFIILLSLVLFSCKKENGEPSGVRMQVLEFNTTKGLPNVKIEMYTCSDYDFVFGCRTTSKFQTAYTDGNGKYQFQGNDFNKSN